MASGVQAGWSFDPPSWDFGTVVPGTGHSPTKTFTLTNTGEVELSPAFIMIGGNEGAGFSIGEVTCGKLAPAATCTIEVVFSPTSGGPKRGQLSVASKGGAAPPVTALLSGTGAGPIVSVAPESRDFGALPLGATSGPKTFTVVNVGSLDLTISSISVDAKQIYNYPGARAEQFEIAGGSCAAVAMAPESSCSIEVVFSPTAPGQLTADLRIDGNAPDLPYAVKLEGVGVGPVAGLPVPPPWVAPRVGIVHRPSRRTRKKRAVFWFRGSPSAARFTCRLDRRLFRACSSPVRYGRLRRGRHRFAVRAIDDSGRGGRSRVFRWSIGKRRS